MSTDVNRLIQEVRSENALWQSRYGLYRLIAGVASVGWLILMLASARSHSALSPLAHYFVFLVLGGIFGHEGIGLLSRPTGRHRHLIKSLTEQDETALVGPLLESVMPAWIAGLHIFHADKTLYYAVNDALTRLLPKLTDVEYRTLNNREKKALYAMLTNDHPEVALPALETVTRFGDTDALPRIKRLARRKPDRMHTKRVMDAANASLCLLQGR